MPITPRRKPNRLKNYDYSQNGAYFVTICSKNRENIFGRVTNKNKTNNNDNNTVNTADVVGATASVAPITDDHPLATVKLTELGKCVDETIRIAGKKNGIKIDKYTIMPNHIHLIIVITDGDGENGGDGQNRGDRGRSPLQYIVRNIKSYVTKWAGNNIWQKSFHDHIIRNDDEYNRIAEYIENNPVKWFLDRENRKNLLNY